MNPQQPPRNPLFPPLPPADPEPTNPPEIAAARQPFGLPNESAQDGPAVIPGRSFAPSNVAGGTQAMQPQRPAGPTWQNQPALQTTQPMQPTQPTQQTAITAPQSDYQHVFPPLPPADPEDGAGQPMSQAGQQYQAAQPQYAAAPADPWQSTPAAGFGMVPPPPPPAYNAYNTGFAALPPPSHKRRNILLAVVGAVVLLTAALYFLWYVPNRPQNVYSTGLNRSGKALDMVVNKTFTEKQLAAVSATEFSGSAEVSGPDKTYSGSFKTQYDKQQSSSSLGYKIDTFGVASSVGQDFTAELLSDIKDGKTYPDIYFKLTGLKSLGLDKDMPGINAYDGKWIGIGSDYIESLIPIMPASTTEQSKNDITPADVTELTKAVTATTREYVMTDDPAKAVLVNKGFVGTEKVESGITANHYTVGFNKANVKLYCKALVKNVLATKAITHFPNYSADMVAEAKTSAEKACDESNGIKDADTFDMWVNKKTKLIHKIRLTDDTDKTLYVDIGQTYTSGSKLPMFIHAHSDTDKYDIVLNVETDMDANATTAKLTASFTDVEQWTVKANMAFRPHKGDVKVTKPADALPIQSVLQTLGIDPASELSGATAGL